MPPLDVSEPFDPLAVENVGVTLAVEFLEQPLHALPPPTPFPGAGVYALYYSGSHPAYIGLRRLEAERRGWMYPVYIGSAVRENARQGFNPRSSSRTRIFGRLRDHANSIAQAPNLDLLDFRCRFLVLTDAYITLAESVMITTFRPAWNGMGFGSKVVGGARMSGQPSPWDSLHPGRGGRPVGGERQAELATSRIAQSIEELASDPADLRIARMVDKIRRFQRGSG